MNVSALLSPMCWRDPSRAPRRRRYAHSAAKLSRSQRPFDERRRQGQFLALFVNRNAVSFSGHTHTTEHHYFGQEAGFAGAAPHHHHVLTAVSGSWWSGPFDRRGIATADSRDGTPHGFHFLSIDGGSYATRFVPASEPNARQMRISLDTEFHFGPDLFRDFRMGQLQGSQLAKDQLAAATLVVNVFDGGPKTKVEYRIGTLRAVQMKRQTRPDPFVEEVYGRNQATIALGESRTFVAYLGRTPTHLARGRHLHHRRACQRRIWP